jgi:hypothetical protein
MLSTYVELSAYEIVLAFLATSRDTKAVVGRVHKYELDNADRFAKESESEELKALSIHRHAEAQERRAERAALLQCIEEREASEKDEQARKSAKSAQVGTVDELDDSNGGLTVSLVNDARNYAVVDSTVQSVLGKDINVELDIATADAAAAHAAASAPEGDVYQPQKKNTPTQKAHKPAATNTQPKKKHTRTLSAEKRAAKNRIRKWHYAAHYEVPPSEIGAAAEPEDLAAGIIPDTEHEPDHKFAAKAIHDAVDATEQLKLSAQPDNKISAGAEKRRRQKEERAASAERRAAKNKERKFHSQMIAQRPPSQPAGLAGQDDGHNVAEDRMQAIVNLMEDPLPNPPSMSSVNSNASFRVPLTAQTSSLGRNDGTAEFGVDSVTANNSSTIVALPAIWEAGVRPGNDDYTASTKGRSDKAKKSVKFPPI